MKLSSPLEMSLFPPSSFALLLILNSVFCVAGFPQMPGVAGCPILLKNEALNIWLRALWEAASTVEWLGGTCTSATCSHMSVSLGPSSEWFLGTQRRIALSLTCGKPGCILKIGVWVFTSLPSFPFSAHCYLLCNRCPQIQRLSDSVSSEPKPPISCLEGEHGARSIHLAAPISEKNSEVYSSLCGLLRDLYC